MRPMTSAATLLLAIWMMAVPAGWAQTEKDKEHAELAAALKEVKLSLEKGLGASGREGTPISGKYEVEHGHLQLSVYTMKGDRFSEVIVDHKTGKIAKVEAITGGDDLAAAKAQREAMAKAKRSLGAAVGQAVTEYAGFRAVSATPVVKDGHPVADVTLVKGAEWTTVSETLD